MPRALFAALLVLTATAGAQQTPELTPLPEGAEPTVSIIRGAEDTVEEYRVNGRLYMVRITPSKGTPYYLIDSDGNGDLETRRNDLDPGIAIPGWVLHTFE